MHPLRLPLLCGVLAACSPTDPAELVIDNLSDSGRQLVVDDDAIFVLDRVDVLRIEADGSSVATVGTTDGAHPVQLAADATRLYWTENSIEGDIRAIDKVGGAATVLALDQAALELVVDSTAVYWISSGWQTEAGVWRQDKSGGSPQLLRPAERARSLGLDSGRLHWCERGDGIDACYTMDPTSGHATLLVRGAVEHIAVVDGRAYYSTTDSSRARLWVVPAAGEQPIQILERPYDRIDDAQAANRFVHIAVAPDGDVYAASANAIFELHPDGAARIAETVVAAPIRVNDEHIFFPRNHDVWRVAR